jgi:hypothetical protein
LNANTKYREREEAHGYPCTCRSQQPLDIGDKSHTHINRTAHQDKRNPDSSKRLASAVLDASRTYVTLVAVR